MANQYTRQYVGARYVPKIFNNNGSNEWIPNYSYEPLTIVLYGNASYTSMTTVPPSIGNPANNPQYWALTGNYNGQLEQIRQDILNLKELVKSNFWNGKKVVVYGDSLSAHFNNYWNILSLITDCTITNRAINGTPLIKSINGNGGVDMAQNANDLNNFDIIVFAYGTNDWQGSYELHSTSEYSIYRAVNLIIDYVLTKAPEKTLLFITPFYSYNPNFFNGELNKRGLKISDYCKEINGACNERGVSCIDFYSTSGCTNKNYTTKLLNDSGGIYVHETANFSKILALIVANFTCSNQFYSNENGEMLSPIMFGDLSINVTNTDINNLQTTHKSGIIFKFTGSITKGNLTLVAYNFYRICGYSSGPIQLEIGSLNININQGYFDIKFRQESTEIGQLKVTAENETLICGLQMYNLSQGGNFNGSYGLFKPFTFSNKVTTGANDVLAGYKLIGDELKSNGCVVKATSALVSEDTILTFSGYSGFRTFITGFFQNSAIMLQIYHNSIQVLSSIPENGVIFIPAFSAPINSSQILL